MILTSIEYVCRQGVYISLEEQEINYVKYVIELFHDFVHFVKCNLLR